MVRSGEALQEADSNAGAAAADPDAPLRSLLLYVGAGRELPEAQRVPPGYLRMDQLAALVPVCPPPAMTPSKAALAVRGASLVKATLDHSIVESF